MKKLKWEAAEAIAQNILKGWKIVHPELTRRLAEIVQREGKAVSIRVYWNVNKQDVDFEVLK